jgi:hypothetical protein
VFLGEWNPRSVELLKTHPRYAGEIAVVGVPHRAYTIRKGNTMIGSMRRAGNNQGWFVKIDGFKFETIPGQGAARFGMKLTDVKLMKTAPEARKAIIAAFDMIDEKVTFEAVS